MTADANDTPDAKSAKEQTVAYNKKAAIFASSLIALLVAGLSVQAIMNHKKHEDAVERPAAQDDAVPEKRKPSNLQDFVEKTASISKRKEEQKQAETKEQERERLRTEIAGRRADEEARRDDEKGGQAHYKSKADLIAQFELEDFERALKARYNGIGLSAKGSASAGGEDQPAKPAKLSSTGDQINAMKKIVAQNEERLAALGGNSMDLLKAITTVKGMPNAANAVVGETAEKGKIDSGEKAPRPGELLLTTGSLISGIETFDTISDYDGVFRGMTSRDVYDVNKEFILIPAGSRVTGQTLRFSKVNEAIQNRTGRTVKWIILPNGARIDMQKSALVDHAGIMGLSGDVDYHLWAQFFGVAAYAVIGIVPSAEVSAGEANSSRDAAARELTSGMRANGRAIAQRYISLTPTIKSSNGTPFKLFIEDDIYLKPWARIDDVYYKPQD